jgi:hypothetical protein
MMAEDPPLFRFFRLVDRFNLDSVAPFIFIALIVGAVIAGCRNSRQANRRMQALRVILNSSAGLLVLLCLLNAIFTIRLLYGHNAPGSSLLYGARAQGVLALLIAGFIYHTGAMALTSIFVLVPSTRTHPDITSTSALFLVSISLPMVIIIYSCVSWGPGIDFHFYVRNLAPPLVCVIEGALWFGFRSGMAVLQKRDARARIIGGLVVFHLVCVCLYTFLVCVLCMRAAAAE